MLNYLMIGFLIVFSMSSYAGICKVDSAKVGRVFQYKDGYIFIDFDKASDCGCPQSARLAFHKDDDEVFFMSAALMALAAGKTVTATGEDSNCPVHGNTAKLTGLYVSAN